jgi:hypothetical protein
MRALKAFPYGRPHIGLLHLKPGDIFEPDNDGDRHVLSVTGMAEEIDAEPKKSKRRYKTRDLRAEDDDEDPRL